MAQIPVISSHVLHGMPAFIREEIGNKALRLANRAVGFDFELIESENCFIPHAAVVGFVEATARAAGEAHFGIMMAPTMNIANYGCFGRYVFGANTLGQAIERSITALSFHSSDDQMSVTIVGDEIRYTYVFALAGRPGYAHVASAAAGVLLSLFKAFLPSDWRPLRIELDIDRPDRTGLYEDIFQCPVLFNAPAVTIVAERHHMSAASRDVTRPIATIEDVARDRRGGAPRTIVNIVVEQIRAQVLTGSVSIDGAAQLMDISVRTLQRELNRAGTDFRGLANAAKAQRAIELLRHTKGSIARIAAELGYSSPANFARAFRKATGSGPRQFRSNEYLTCGLLPATFPAPRTR
jgi:AraC-like DNA-binding protein